MIASTAAGRPYDVPRMVSTEFVNQVRLHVINTAIDTSHVPDTTAVAAALDDADADVKEAFRLLAEGHVLPRMRSQSPHLRPTVRRN